MAGIKVIEMAHGEEALKTLPRLPGFSVALEGKAVVSFFRP